jgi:SAM-dependent methyltransferase
MKRKFLFSCYQSPRGKLLQSLEVDYLKRSITVGCKQTILQIGGLGWENEFIDCTLYERFTIIDTLGEGWQEASKIRARAFSLPIQTESVDLVILPHILEFDAQRFQTMREVERVLKPEGDLIVLSLNPWSLWLRTQYLWDRKLADSWWQGHFISRSRLLDWLKLLNFEVKTSAEFDIDSVKLKIGSFSFNKNTVLATAYAIKAVKRRYTLIPLEPAKFEAQPLFAATGMESSREQHND